MKQFILNGVVYRETYVENYYVTETGIVARALLDEDGVLQFYNRLSAETDKGGYKRVYINKTTKRWHLVHRLVYGSWGLEPLDELKVIDHIDGNKANNDIHNLRQVTQKENIHACIVKGNHSSCYGSNRKRIAVYDTITKVTTIYDSVRDFAIELGIKRFIKNPCITSIKRCARCRRYEIIVIQ